jgi:hypothetical protein
LPPCFQYVLEHAALLPLLLLLLLAALACLDNADDVLLQLCLGCKALAEPAAIDETITITISSSSTCVKELRCTCLHSVS